MLWLDLCHFINRFDKKMGEKMSWSAAGMFSLDSTAEHRFGKDCLDLALIYTMRRHADLRFNLSQRYKSRGAMSPRMIKGCSKVLLELGNANISQP